MGIRRIIAVAGVTCPFLVIACTTLDGLTGGVAGTDAGSDGPLDPDVAPPVLTRDGSAEAAAKSCGTAEKLCANACVSDNDPTTGCRDQCSACPVPANAAGAICRQQDGRCGLKCSGSRADCDRDPSNGCEIDLLDPNNCGRDCDGRTVCSGALPFCAAIPGGAPGCVAGCPLAQTPCGGSCADTATSLSHCGSCGSPCVGAANLVATCRAGSCEKACAPGFGDCDGNPANGCEPLVPTWDDLDGDGFGGVQKEATCPNKVPPGRATRGGDCEDSRAEVNPGQTKYIEVGYTRTGGGLSYDYDCNGVEEDLAKRGDPLRCAPGYVPLRDDRGPKTNTFCGATSYLTGGTSSASGSGSASGSASGTTVSCIFSTGIPVACR